MKVSLGLTLLLAACFMATVGLCQSQGQDISLSPEEQILVNELSPYQDHIRTAFANSLFGKNIRPKPQAELTCTLCRTALYQVIGWIRQGVPRETIKTRLVNLCVTLNIVPGDMCADVIEQYIDIALQIFADRTWLTRIDVCGIVMKAGPALESFRRSGYQLSIQKPDYLIFHSHQGGDDDSFVR